MALTGPGAPGATPLTKKEQGQLKDFEGELEHLGAPSTLRLFLEGSELTEKPTLGQLAFDDVKARLDTFSLPDLQKAHDKLAKDKKHWTPARQAAFEAYVQSRTPQKPVQPPQANTEQVNLKAGNAGNIYVQGVDASQTAVAKLLALSTSDLLGAAIGIRMLNRKDQADALATVLHDPEKMKAVQAELAERMDLQEGVFEYEHAKPEDRQAAFEALKSLQGLSNWMTMLPLEQDHQRAVDVVRQLGGPTTPDIGPVNFATMEPKQVIAYAVAIRSFGTPELKDALATALHDPDKMKAVQAQLARKVELAQMVVTDDLATPEEKQRAAERLSSFEGLSNWLTALPLDQDHEKAQEVIRHF